MAEIRCFDGMLIGICNSKHKTVDFRIKFVLKYKWLFSGIYRMKYQNL